MNKQILLLALLGTALLGSAVFLAIKENKTTVQDESVAKLWAQWKRTYGKKFADPDFEQYRMEVFASNLEIVKKDKSGTFGITKFFDLTQDEFVSTYLTEMSELSAEPVAADVDVDTSISINWVNANKVTAVKNQGSCGSCWTFSATGAVESALIIAGKAEQTVNLSEQQLIDCCTSAYNNAGCGGGNKDTAFLYIQRNSITTEANYPYKAQNGSCNATLAAQAPTYHISGYKQVNAATASLATALATQPIAISVDATNWSFYTGGVFPNTKCNNNTHNHAVLLVGLENGNWIVKNSWGPNWGENGYIRLQNGNTCGLANVPYYPTA